MQHRPRGLIRTQLHLSLHLRCRYADLVAHHAPRGREPDRQRRTRLVKDRARRRRHLPLTTATLPAAIRQTPSRGTRAVRTYESVGPSQPIQVVQTLPVLIEPRPHLRVRRAGNHAQHHARNSLNQGTKMESPLIQKWCAAFDGSRLVKETSPGAFGRQPTPAAMRHGLPRTFPQVRSRLFVPFCNDRFELKVCLLYTSDAADDLTRVDLGGRR